MKKEPHLLLRRVSYLKSLFLMTCLLIIATSTLAQTKNVIGTVTDISGEALIGVSILVQGTNNGVVSYCIYNHRTTKTNQKYPSVNL